LIDVRRRHRVAENQRSLVIIKPDAVQRGLIGEILARYERRGLRIAAMKLEVVSPRTAEEHYAEHQGKPFFAGLVEYITSSPSVVLILEGPEAVGIVRKMNGARRPAEAEPGTVRGDYGLTVGRNLVHASDSVQSAAREVGIFFDADVTVDYRRAIDPWIDED